MTEDLLSKALGALPQGLRADLLAEFNEVLRAFREGKWREAELHGGRFAEVAYVVVAGFFEPSFPDSMARAPKRGDFKVACDDLGRKPKTSGPDSIRISIPRMLVSLYHVRNDRNVGHVGGDVSPDRMDATVVISIVKWVMAELVRVLHQTTTAEATQVVESLTERSHPILWEVDGRRRVLDTRLSLADATLVLVYGLAGPADEVQLADDLEQKRRDNYRRVLRKLHAERMVEFNERAATVTLSPLGIRRVEEVLGAS